MTIGKIFFLCCLPAFICTEAFAQTPHQDSLIKSQTIQITQIYQPKVEQPSMPELIPMLPPPDTTKPQFQYTVPQQTLSYTYHSVAIRPLALGKVTETNPFQNYLKVGAGNLSSLYLDAGIGSVKGKNYQTTFHISHLNQSGNIVNQKSGYTRFYATGKYSSGGQIFEADLGIRDRRNRFYGYNDDLYQYNKNVLQQNLTDGALSLSMRNATANSLKINYHPELTFGAFKDNFNAHENRLTFHLPIAYSFGNSDTGSVTAQKSIRGKISLGLYGNLVHLNNPVQSTSNNLVKVNPALDLNFHKVKLHIGLSPAFGKNTTYLLPDLSIHSGFIQNHIQLKAGWKEDVLQNTYLDLSLFNPFMDNVFSIHQTKSDQVFAGVESSVNKFVTFGVTFSWRQWKNLPLFINDYTLNPDGKQFQVIFDRKVQAFNLEAYIRYQPSETIALSAKGSWYNFYKTTTDKVWGYPMAQLDGLIEFHPIKKLYAHAGITYLNGIYALLANQDSKKMAGITDLNIGAEYNIISRFSLFLQASNLLNEHYQRWNQYPVYGINLIGGFRFKF